MSKGVVVGLVVYSVLLPFVLNVLVFGKESVVLYSLEKVWRRLTRGVGCG